MGSSKAIRASVACNVCRDSKLKCINDDHSTKCQRCLLLNLDCSYTLKESQLKRKHISLKYPSVKKVKTIDGERASKPEVLPVPNSHHHRVHLPEKGMLLEVLDIFFENQYKGIFPLIHKPSFLGFMRLAEFVPETYLEEYETRFLQENCSHSLKYPDPVVILAILALCSRLHPKMAQIYGRFSEDEAPQNFAPNFGLQDPILDSSLSTPSQASNYFGWNARHLLKNVFDSPTIQRVQALCILSSHEWGEANSSRSYMYVGLAARMALVLGLGNESDFSDTLDPSTRFIYAETQRRTIWLVYMMDRCNSSGRNRSSCIRLEDIKVQLPSQEKDFLFGNYRLLLMAFKEAYRCIRDTSKHENLQKLSCFAFQIVLFEIWAKIAKWVGEVGGKLEPLPPWDLLSAYNLLSEELETFELSLPVHLQFSRFNLEAHIADGSGGDFGYFHCLFFLCRLFLNREYLFCSPESFPAGWWEGCTRTLLQTLDNFHEVTALLRSTNVMVIAPFTGFGVFSTAATCLYFCAFPNSILVKNYPLKGTASEDTVLSLKGKYQDMAQDSMCLLKTWARVWGLGRNWSQTTIRLEKLFNLGLVEESPTLNDDTIRHTLHDYGNGRVMEVHKPEITRKIGMHILTLLVEDSGEVASGKAISPVASRVEREAAGLLLNSPALDFMNNFDLGTIFPGWSDAMKIQTG